MYAHTPMRTSGSGKYYFFNSLKAFLSFNQNMLREGASWVGVCVPLALSLCLKIVN